MLKVSATKFRNHLFDYLDKVANGETIIIERNHQEIAKVAPTKPRDWRDGMMVTLQSLVSNEELMKPLADVWAGYL